MMYRAPNSADWQTSRQQSGLSLVELIIFIVIVSIVTTGVLLGLNRILTGSATINQLTQAAYLAQQRMELILPQREVLGFSGFISTTFDPCTSTPASTQPICTVIPAGYTVTTTLSNDWQGDSAYKVVVVTVTGKGSAQLQALVADY